MARGLVSLAHPRYTQAPTVWPGVGTNVIDEVVVVVVYGSTVELERPMVDELTVEVVVAAVGELIIDEVVICWYILRLDEDEDEDEGFALEISTAIVAKID